MITVGIQWDYYRTVIDLFHVFSSRGEIAWWFRREYLSDYARGLWNHFEVAAIFNGIVSGVFCLRYLEIRLRIARWTWDKFSKRFVTFWENAIHLHALDARIFAHWIQADRNLSCEWSAHLDPSIKDVICRKMNQQGTFYSNVLIAWVNAIKLKNRIPAFNSNRLLRLALFKGHRKG